MEEFNANPFTRTRPYVPAKKNEEEIQRLINETFDQLPILKQEAERLAKRLDATDSIAEALTLAKQYEISTDNALIVLNTVRQILAKEKLIIEERVKDAAKR